MFLVMIIVLVFYKEKKSFQLKLKHKEYEQNTIWSEF
jgi:hypothetical protein